MPGKQTTFSSYRWCKFTTNSSGFVSSLYLSWFPHFPDCIMLNTGIVPRLLLYTCWLLFWHTMLYSLVARYQSFQKNPMPPYLKVQESLPPWRWKQYAPQTCWYLFTKLHGITSHKTVVFLLTSVITTHLFHMVSNSPYWQRQQFLLRVHCFYQTHGVLLTFYTCIQE
jgi:hypothetical protein